MTLDRLAELRPRVIEQTSGVQLLPIHNAIFGEFLCVTSPAV